jgi:hypothetical protein
LRAAAGGLIVIVALDFVFGPDDASFGVAVETDGGVAGIEGEGGRDDNEQFLHGFELGDLEIFGSEK